VLLGRTNFEIKALTAQYESVARKRASLAGKRPDEAQSLRATVEGDVRGNLRKLYLGVLCAARKWETPCSASRPTSSSSGTFGSLNNTNEPVMDLEADILDLHASLTGDVGVDTVLKYFIYASFHRLSSISRHWKRVTRDDLSLEQRIVGRFRGDVEDALLYLLLSATDEALRDATMLHRSLSKSGSIFFSVGKSGRVPKNTKQEEIAVKVAKLIWRDHALTGTQKPNGTGKYASGDYLREVDKKYVGILEATSRAVNKGELLQRIQKETSGEFVQLLVQLWTTREQGAASV